MELSDLTAYVETKYHIREEHKWADFPGFSVLSDPGSGKWLALLMRQWDSTSGAEIQRCDIKCGQDFMMMHYRPYLCQPFRMYGSRWTGVAFDSRTEEDVVFRLFDEAVAACSPHGCTIVLENPPSKTQVVCPETERRTSDEDFRLSSAAVPDRILRMIHLYEYRGSSFTQKCRNFLIQGKFMEDYEDNAPWNGELRCYFPVYHDLTIGQLRGYFTWRTDVRKGIFSPVPLSLAYIYLYELLNGIGASSAQDSMDKLNAFETGFLDKGMGDAVMRRNLHRWMFDFAVMNSLPVETALRHASGKAMKTDTALEVLRDPGNHSDDEIFSSLCAFAKKKPEQSLIMRKYPDKGKHVFAAVWKEASSSISADGRNPFAICFGAQKEYPWHPLVNAVYHEKRKHLNMEYTLTPCRTYICREGVWRERRYDSLNFDLKTFNALLHETDRILRLSLRCGHYLKKADGCGWAENCIRTVIEAERKAEEESSRPVITIDISSLDKIREDASLTRDSLLTEEDMEDYEDDVVKTGLSMDDEGDAGDSSIIPYRELLTLLLQGKSVSSYLSERHLMPSIAADTVNEALFDEIGDNVLECDGDTLTLVEDYRDDVLDLLGGKTNEK